MTHPLVRLVDIRETPLDVAEVLAQRSTTTATAGVTLFVGRVRDHDQRQGRRRSRLLRPPDGAGHAARRSASGSPTEHDVHGVAAVHRVGSLAIGDIAVVVAAAAAHRGEAFDASRALIDTLKAEVPIWKHQRFADGTEEWVGHAVAPASLAADRASAFLPSSRGDPALAGAARRRHRRGDAVGGLAGPRGPRRGRPRGRRTPAGRGALQTSAAPAAPPAATHRRCRSATAAPASPYAPPGAPAGAASPSGASRG